MVSSTVGPVASTSACELRVPIGANFPETHCALEQGFGGRNQLYAIRKLLGWIVLEPAGQIASIATSMNKIEAEAD